MNSTAIISAVNGVTKKWAKVRKAEERQERRAERRWDYMRSRERVTFKDVADEEIPKAYEAASANGTLPANARQIMYAARPAMQDLTGRPLDDQYFTQVLLPNFVAAHPEVTNSWDVVYDARGNFLEPHTNHRVPLGTLAVRTYLNDVHHFSPDWVDCVLDEFPEPFGSAPCDTKGPQHRFGAVLFIEKEGFLPLFEKVDLARRFDLAIMSTKGVSVTAARQLIDDLSGYARDELGTTLPLLVLHDFDKSGFTILGTFTRESRRYEYHNNLEVIDLGLRLRDIRKLQLQSEKVFVKGEHPSRNLTANGATKDEIEFLLHGNSSYNGTWGQRVELNAMRSDQFVAWLEAKLVRAGVKKVVPEEETLQAAYKRLVAQRDLSEAIMQATARIVEERRDLKVPRGLRAKLIAKLKKSPRSSWDSMLAGMAEEEELLDV